MKNACDISETPPFGIYMYIKTKSFALIRESFAFFRESFALICKSYAFFAKFTRYFAKNIIFFSTKMSPVSFRKDLQIIFWKNYLVRTT